ncbi:apoptosis inhibitor 5 [Panicum miliaceum]|uniref:Apoptosis inhibitor 5 n=1 Tax=Panicum miliaceum TaxID=4540 RepID=A0A3L6QCY7_PANMI|nr:apoptosis inhibitor 5 [Panicum miliaceum]
MAAADADAAEVERLYELGERLSSAKDKSEHAADYEAIIAAVKGQSVKAKQLAAQLIPRFFRSFPALATRAMSAMFDLVEMEELATTPERSRSHAPCRPPALVLCPEGEEHPRQLPKSKWTSRRPRVASATQNASCEEEREVCTTPPWRGRRSALRRPCAAGAR